MPHRAFHDDDDELAPIPRSLRRFQTETRRPVDAGVLLADSLRNQPRVITAAGAAAEAGRRNRRTFGGTVDALHALDRAVADQTDEFGRTARRLGSHIAKPVTGLLAAQNQLLGGNIQDQFTSRVAAQRQLAAAGAAADQPPLRAPGPFPRPVEPNPPAYTQQRERQAQLGVTPLFPTAGGLVGAAGSALSFSPHRDALFNTGSTISRVYNSPGVQRELFGQEAGRRALRAQQPPPAPLPANIARNIPADQHPPASEPRFTRTESVNPFRTLQQSATAPPDSSATAPFGVRALSEDKLAPNEARIIRGTRVFAQNIDTGVSRELGVHPAISTVSDRPGLADTQAGLYVADQAFRGKVADYQAEVDKKRLELSAKAQPSEKEVFEMQLDTQKFNQDLLNDSKIDQPTFWRELFQVAAGLNDALNDPAEVQRILSLHIQPAEMARLIAAHANYGFAKDEIGIIDKIFSRYPDVNTFYRDQIGSPTRF